jgi:hypothetical protein
MSINPQMQKSRVNAGFFQATLAATREADCYFRYPDNARGKYYSTLKNIEDYALAPFQNFQDPFTILWMYAPLNLKKQIVEYMANSGRVGADQWPRIHRVFGHRHLPEPPVPPEYLVNNGFL